MSHIFKSAPDVSVIFKDFVEVSGKATVRKVSSPN
jgi:hypothetical protein